jgi:hypothetical protein
MKIGSLYVARKFPISLWSPSDKHGYIHVILTLGQNDLLIIINEHYVLTKHGISHVWQIPFLKNFKKLS